MDSEIRRTINEIGRRSYNPNFQHHWEFLNVDNLRFDKPTVICLSGSGTTDNKTANGIAKIVQNYLDLMFKTKDGKTAVDYIDIMGIKYVRPDYCYSTNLMTSSFANQLTNAMVALLTDANGHKLSLEQAQKNMSRITFFTYCYGKLVLNDLINRLNKKLAELNYTEAEIVAINNASQEVSFAPRITEENKIPSVQVISQNDSVNNSVLKNIYTPEKLAELNGITLHTDTTGTLYGQKCEAATAPSIQIVSSKLLNTFNKTHLYFDDHNIKCVSRDNDWNLKTFQVRGETIHSPNADCVSQMMAWALCRGVENSIQNFTATKYLPKTYWQDMVPELQSIIDSYATEKLAKPTAKFIGRRQQNIIEPLSF